MEENQGRIINDTNAPEIIPKVKDIFTTLIEINNLYEFIDQLNDDSPAMDPTGDEVTTMIISIQVTTLMIFRRKQKSFKIRSL